MKYIAICACNQCPYKDIDSDKEIGYNKFRCRRAFSLRTLLIVPLTGVHPDCPLPDLKEKKGR